MQLYRGIQRQFSENICSEDELRSGIFETFVVTFSCLPASPRIFELLKRHLHARAKKIGTACTPNFWHRADDFKARHSQFSTSERIGTKCNVAPVLKILGMPRLPPGGSLATGKLGTVPTI